MASFNLCVHQITFENGSKWFYACWPETHASTPPRTPPPHGMPLPPEEQRIPASATSRYGTCGSSVDELYVAHRVPAGQDFSPLPLSSPQHLPSPPRVPQPLPQEACLGACPGNIATPFDPQTLHVPSIPQQPANERSTTAPTSLHAPPSPKRARFERTTPIAAQDTPSSEPSGCLPDSPHHTPSERNATPRLLSPFESPYVKPREHEDSFQESPHTQTRSTRPSEIIAEEEIECPRTDSGTQSNDDVATEPVWCAGRRLSRITRSTKREQCRGGAIKRKRTSESSTLGDEWPVIALIGSERDDAFNLRYYVQWETGQRTWEPASCLHNCDASLAQYHNDFPSAPGRRWAARRLFPRREFENTLFQEWLDQN